MNKTVEIVCDDQGQYSVGLEPQEQEQAEGQAGGEQAPEGYLKPVKSLDDALQVARDLLSGSTGEQAQAAENEQGFRAGFAGGDQAQDAKGFG